MNKCKICGVIHNCLDTLSPECLEAYEFDFEVTYENDPYIQSFFEYMTNSSAEEKQKLVNANDQCQYCNGTGRKQ